MSKQSFKLESSAISYDLEVENGEISVILMRKLKSCRIDQVTKVVQKQTSMSGGDEVSFRIFFNNNGKEDKFPWVQTRVNAPSTKACFDYLKSILPASVQWTDQREEKAKDEAGRTVYDLQFLPLGYAGAGLPRGVQLWIYMLGLGVLIIPLILIAKILATGGYRIYASDNGIEIKKLGSTKLNWNEIEQVKLTNVNVVDGNNYSSTHVMKLEIKSNAGKNYSAVMRLDHAVPLMKEMAKHNLISEELIAKYS